MYPGISRFWKSTPQRAVASGYMQSKLKGGEGEVVGQDVAYALTPYGGSGISNQPPTRKSFLRGSRILKKYWMILGKFVM